MELDKSNLEFLHKICNLYGLNFDEAVKKLNAENTDLDYTIKIVKKRKPPLPQERCIAYLNQKVLCQCILRKSIGSFCARHFTMHTENRLKNGTIKKHV
jgi:hypothetical protein